MELVGKHFHFSRMGNSVCQMDTQETTSEAVMQIYEKKEKNFKPTNSSGLKYYRGLQWAAICSLKKWTQKFTFTSSCIHSSVTECVQRVHTKVRLNFWSVKKAISLTPVTLMRKTGKRKIQLNLFNQIRLMHIFVRILLYLNFIKTKTLLKTIIKVKNMRSFCGGGMERWFSHWSLDSRSKIWKPFLLLIS